MTTQQTQLLITKYDLLYEQRMSTVEAGFKAANKNIEEIMKDIREIRKDTRSDFRWLIGLMIGGFGSLFALMAHGFHWII